MKNKKNPLTPATLSVAIAAALGAPGALAATITVDSLADSGSAETCTLRQAIGSANTDSATGACTAGAGTDTIVFGAGLNGTITLSGSQLEITEALTITGPGAAQLSIDANALSRVLHIVNSGAVSISGVTLTNGLHGTVGGGILASDTDLELVDTVVTGNRVVSTGAGFVFGGGISSTNGDLRLERVAVSDNHLLNEGSGTASARGGGIDFNNGLFELIDSVVSGNSVTTRADSGSGALGGGAATSEANVLIQNSRIVDNSVLAETAAGGVSSASTEGSGAGLFSNDNNTPNTLTVVGSVISGNFARISTSGAADYEEIKGYGGGLRFRGEVTLTDTVISGNTVGIDAQSEPKNREVYARGGGVEIGRSDAHQGPIQFSGVTISDNRVDVVTTASISESNGSASGGGARIDTYDAEMSFANIIVSGNSVSISNHSTGTVSQSVDGGGLAIRADAVTITNSILSDNLIASTSSGANTFGNVSGGGAFVSADSGNAVLTNTTLAGNSARRENSATVADVGNASGGGIQFDYVPAGVLVANSTISGNFVDTGSEHAESRARGAGIFIYSQSESNRFISTTIAENVIGDNSTQRVGAGIYAGAGQSLELLNTLVAANVGAGDCEAGSGSNIDGAHSLLGSTDELACGLSNDVDGNVVGQAPQLSPLADNGCATMAGAPGTTRCAPTHALLADSLAIDAGSDLTTDYATDQRGTSRPIGAAFDIGAFEAGALNVCGEATSQSWLSAPNGSLCTSGTPSPVVAAAGDWSWSCNDVFREPTQCSAAGAATNGGEGPAGSVTFELPEDAGCTVTSVQPVAADTPPPGVTLPYGLVSFDLTSCTGTTANVRATFSGPVEGMSLYKHIGSEWTVVQGATLSGNTVSFDIEDNGPYDTNAADGAISDPFGPGVSASATGTTTAIPTLSQWALIVSSALLALIGMRSRRPRR